MATYGGINVIAIGDSNTYGFGASDVTYLGAWRYHFGLGISQYLRANPNWVGENPAIGLPDAGSRMCGAIGQRVDQIIGSTYDAASQFLRQKPDLGVFLIGVNDCNQIYTGSWVGGSISTSISNMSTLLDNFRTARPYGIAVVAKLPPSTTSGVNDQILLWNAALDVMIASRSDLQYLFVADLYTAFTSNPSWATDYMWNFLHYNNAGHQLIANTFISTLTSNVTSMPRATAQSRRMIKPHVGALIYTASTATTFSGTTLDTTQPWAVSMDIDMSRMPGGIQGIVSLATDKGTQFMFAMNPNNDRGFEFGNGTNYNRFFPNTAASPVVTGRYLRGWTQLLIIFKGGTVTTATNYEMYLNGNAITVTSGSGFASASNLNQIGASMAGATAGNFDMADLTIWNGGSVMTASQVADWYKNHVLPTGPTLIRRYQHTDLSGSTLTDSTGNANATIGTATWTSTNLPTRIRTNAGVRTLATARSLAV